MNKIILASQSPRRRELMAEAGYTFDVVPAAGEEVIPPDTPPREIAMMLALQKAREVAALHSDSTIVAADTIVVVDGDVLGKPIDRAGAVAMLKRLSARRHTVYTGVAIRFGEQGREVSFAESTEVTFHALSDAQINAYVDTSEPFDKAGAYGIQGKGMLLVKRIDGDFYNVMGLPISRVSRILSGADDMSEQQRYGIDDLLGIMERLRVECPWDKEQTHASIRVNVIEEAYEVAEAIDNADSTGLCEELGDLLLQVVFHAKIASESDAFDFNGVCDAICRKLIYRHPHVFDTVHADTKEKVLENWETLKAKSKGDMTTSDRLNAVPKTLPALMRGEKVGKRAADSGFDFAGLSDTIACLKSEISELELAILNKKNDEIEHEFGDVLFSCCNVGRFLEKDCEKVLTTAINRFIIRFRGLEGMVAESGKSINELDAKQLDELWQISKNNSKVT
ncbi:MAG: nucleoside triphosphate pyrophosphohydrolase [Oscillospiraceae bacterium]|nr:nucleoside triphosphate pyrophosphohydrolase [Oscillospiraceae bacterium]